MPKSRFNAVREKARASRHNPLQQRNANPGKDGGTQETVVALQAANNTDILPVLQSLPLGSTSIAPGDILWGLSSLTSFLSVKSHRNDLLSPKHNVVARILAQLSNDRPLEVRDAASGCLRNLCIEAGGKPRKVLESQGCVPICLSQLNSAAQDLGFILKEEGTHSDLKPKTDMSFLQKPKSEMNRKERRHAAKAEAAAAKVLKNDTSIQGEQTPPARESVDYNPLDDEHAIVLCSHLNNLTAVIWCLAEQSELATEICERSAPLLCRTFVQVLTRAIQSYKDLVVEEETAQGDNVHISKIDVGKKQKSELNKAYIELATTSLNALVTLSESNPRICAVLVGLSQEELRREKRGKSRSFVLEIEDNFTKGESKQSLFALHSAIDNLSRMFTDPRWWPSTSLERSAVSLGLLSIACLQNIQYSLPTSLLQPIHIPFALEDPKSGHSILHYGLKCALPALHKVVHVLSHNSLGPIIEQLTTHNNDQAPEEAPKSAQLNAQDNANIANLALEILTELVGDRTGWSLQDKSNQGKGDKEVDDSEEIDMEGVEEDLEENLGDEMNSEGRESTFNETRIATIFSEQFVDDVASLVFQSGERVTSSNSAMALRYLHGICVRSLSILNNSLIVLASFASPPPSQPIGSSEQQERIEVFQNWMSQKSRIQQFAKLWRWCFELASRMAALPHVSSDPASLGDIPDNRRVIEGCLGIMWGVARCFEGTTNDLAEKVLIIDAVRFADDQFCQTAKDGSGVVESLIAAYRGSKNEESVANHENEEVSLSTHLNSTDDWASSDGIRANCLGVLSSIARQNHVWPSNMETITELLVRTIEVVPTSSTSAAKLAQLQLSDTTSIDGMVVAINGIVDIYADETKPWDFTYDRVKAQSMLKASIVHVRNAVSTHPSAY